MVDSASTGARARNPRGHGLRLRDEIVAAAEELLLEKPAEALSLRAVARHAGVSAPALYPHFPDRRALLWATLEDLFEQLTTATTEATAHAKTSGARLRSWCLAYCQYGLEHQGHYRFLFESWSAERVDVPVTELPGYQLRASLVGVVAECAAAADDVEELSTLLWAGLHGLVSLRINKPSFPWPPIETLVTALLTALQLQPTPARRNPR